MYIMCDVCVSGTYLCSTSFNIELKVRKCFASQPDPQGREHAPGPAEEGRGRGQEGPEKRKTAM